MTEIYIDPSVAGMPDAADHLAHLVESGHDLVLVGDCPRASRGGLARRGPSRPACPIASRPGSWYVSADPAMCGDRRAGLQTLLVGPRLAPSPRPGPRCDAEARDLASAVLEILRRDVMG